MRLQIQPMPAARPRVADGHAYTPKAYRVWLDECSWLARLAWKRPPLEGPVRVVVVFEPDALEVEIVPSERPRFGRADLDNTIKSLLDSLTRAGVFVDDRQVVEIEARFG